MNEPGVGKTKGACRQCVELRVERHCLAAPAAPRGWKFVPAVGCPAEAMPRADRRVDVGRTDEECLSFLAHRLRNEVDGRDGELRHPRMMSAAADRNNARSGEERAKGAGPRDRPGRCRRNDVRRRLAAGIGRPTAEPLEWLQRD